MSVSTWLLLLIQVAVQRPRVVPVPLMLPAWATGPHGALPYDIELEPGVGLPARVTTPPVRLRVTPRRLARAALTSGRPPGLFPAAFTLTGRDYRQWRIWSALGFIEPDGHGGLRRTQDFTQLDPTEQGHLNYALAGTLLKALAADQLDSPWLAHLSLAHRAGYVLTRVGRTREEPDYFGPTFTHEYLVGEAKGRQLVKPALKRDLDGKRQTGQVTHVNHQAVIRRYGLAATANTRQVKIYVTDPPTEIAAPTSPDPWIRAYYGMVIEVADALDEDLPGPSEDRALREAGWKPVRWEIPSVARRWARGEGAPLADWEAEAFLVRQSSPEANPDLTALLDVVDTDAADTGVEPPPQT